jgi:hypothetical protein
LRHYATSHKVEGLIPDEVIGFFSLPNPSSRIMALGSTQPLTGMNYRDHPGSKGLSERKVDNLTAIFEPIIYKMLPLRRLTTLWAFTAYYSDNFSLASY